MLEDGKLLMASWIQLQVKEVEVRKEVETLQVRPGIPFHIFKSEHSLFQLFLVTATAWTSLSQGPRQRSKLRINRSVALL